MLIIRLFPMGRKRKKHYRIVVSKKQKHVSKMYLELLGTFNPYTKLVTFKDVDRIKFYIDNGAGLSETVKSLLVRNSIIENKQFTK